MEARFLNFGDDVHEHLARERIAAVVQRIPQSWPIWIGWFPCAKHRKR